ncbi:iron chelate uptake ABC transporter family permease subunit [Agrobacterium vitis]|nr:iron chelate uptake ABC transporter family permease subunit [Allorhizobium sp. Av2]MCM2438548.1 iron chelate uptake ABC transporter family permease subunit [Agrobacterium vitis]MCM2473115.1 iron chelate uptake ABC transporter family permease subunit [Rhizobium sp. CG5]
MRARSRLWLPLLLIVLVAAFLLFRSELDFEYIIPKRLDRLAAMMIGGVCVAFSAVVFQIIAGNRILTPAIMGYEAVYLLFQSLLTLLLGGHRFVALNSTGYFFLSVLLMLAYSWVLHQWLFRDGKRNVYFLLLTGLILTMLFGTFAQFIAIKLSPSDFAVLQGASIVSFNRAQSVQIAYSVVLVVASVAVVLRTLSYLDVLSLGRDQAISLGINHRQYVRLYLALIAALVAVSTSLIGPTAFMGVFVANITYSITRATRPHITLSAACATAICVFIVAQFLVEHVFNYKTTVSILVNLVCGIYFLMLMIRTRGAA